MQHTDGPDMAITAEPFVNSLLKDDTLPIEGLMKNDAIALKTLMKGNILPKGYVCTVRIRH